MLCLKCGKKETLYYSEKCEDCENGVNRSLGFLPNLAIIYLNYAIFLQILLAIKDVELTLLLINLQQFSLLPISLSYLLISISIVVLAVITNYLFFKRKKRMTYLFIVTWLLWILSQCINFIICYLVIDAFITPMNLFMFFKDIIIAIAWISYIFNSDKVKQYFIN